MTERIMYLKGFIFRCKVLFTAFVAVSMLTSPVFIPSAFAQIPKIPGITQADRQASESEPKAVSPVQQREVVKQALAEATTQRERSGTAPQGISNHEAKERYLLLDGLVTRISSQLSFIDELDELRRNRKSLEVKAGSWAGFAEPPPYSILQVDELVRSVLTARSRVQGLGTNQELLAQQVSQYRDLAKQARVLERQTDDTLAEAQTAGERAIAAWQKDQAELRARNADAMAASIALRYEVLGERLGVAGVELELLERQLETARNGLVFSRADLDKALASLKTSRLTLEQELESSLARDTALRDTLARTRQELNAFNLRTDRGNRSATSRAGLDVLDARNRAALAWVESARFETDVITALIAINKATAAFWEKRYNAITGKNAEVQRDILAELLKSQERLRPWLEYTQQQTELYQAAEREQESRLEKLRKGTTLRIAEQDLLAALRLQRQLAERQKSAVEQTDLERQGWLEEIERAQQTRSAVIRLKDWMGIGSEILQRVWRFELFAVEDTVEVAGQKIVSSRGVTVGKSVGALLLFLAGYLIAVYMGRRFQQIMISRFGVGEHQANVIRRWLLAMIIFILIIITLNLARIPLTVFAFFGGALAIGVGFGTQTIIKNFISGILILLERNIKVGDTIDVDGVVGRIVTVDTRASTVLGFDGVETVIPNSMFLESKVTNWTHTNARLRRIVRVGVAYGSPVTKVRDILSECANTHASILKEPAPQALFEDFGDSSLVFALYFWIDYGPEVNPLQVASDLRFMIDKRFAEEKIVLAFPQRDVHLDSSGPLRIEVVSPAPTGE